MITDYMKFQAKLYPVLPFLFYQASKAEKRKPTLPPFSENLILGTGNRKILILGESTVAGVGATSMEFTLAGHLNRELGNQFQFTNLGKNGLRASQSLSYFYESLRLTQGKLEGVLIFIGANDCFRLTHPKKYRAELNSLIDFLKAKYSADWIYLADIPPVQLFPAFPKFLKTYLAQQRNFLQDEMESIAENRHDILFDRIKIEMSLDFFASDGIHPSDLGYQKIAKFAISGLEKNKFLIRAGK